MANFKINTVHVCEISETHNTFDLSNCPQTNIFLNLIISTLPNNGSIKPFADTLPTNFRFSPYYMHMIELCFI